MPWFEPFPSQEEFEYWGFGIPPIIQVSGHNFVNSWPKPNGPRLDCDFTLKWSENFYRSPYLWWVAYWISDPFPPGPETLFNCGYLETFPTSMGHMEGSLPADENGTSLTANIDDVDELSPGQGPGVRLTLNWQRPNGASLLDEYIWRYETNPATARKIGTYNGSTGSNTRTLSPTWTYRANNMSFAGVSDCYQFRETPPLDQFANFNGTNALIQLNSSIIPNAAVWYIGCEIRPRNANNIWIFGGPSTANSAVGINGNVATHGARTFTMTSAPPLNQWSMFEIMRGWDGDPSNLWRIRINGATVHSSTSAASTVQPDRLGQTINKSQVPLWGDFDLRDLLYESSNPSNPTELLNMPLRQNTCDLSSFGNHGTPINVDLPACPV